MGTAGWFFGAFGAGFAVMVVSAPATAEPYIAGTKPSERPQNAPIITEFVKPEGWSERALKGVESPYPASLSFLEDQGAWFTPFNHPGMTGPYDIRQWHGGE